MKNPRKLSAPLVQVAERLRAEREAERFSQNELATAIGMTRVALSSFELCENPLSFRAGYEFCRRLDILPRWLATGEEPKRPFAPLAELGLTPAEVRKHMRRGNNFLDGYDAVLRHPINAWLKKNPAEAIVARMFQGGPEPVVRRMSNLELVSRLQDSLKSLQKPNDPELSAQLKLGKLMLDELQARVEAWQQKSK